MVMHCTYKFNVISAHLYFSLTSGVLLMPLVKRRRKHSPSQGWILGEANEVVASGTPFFRDAMPPIESFALSFCIVLLNSLWTTLESHLISSEAIHVFQNKAKHMCKCAKRGSSTMLAKQCMTNCTLFCFFEEISVIAKCVKLSSD